MPLVFGAGLLNEICCLIEVDTVPQSLEEHIVRRLQDELEEHNLSVKSTDTIRE